MRNDGGHCVIVTIPSAMASIAAHGDIENT